MTDRETMRTEKTPVKVGIIGAMQIEVEELIAHMTDREEREISGIRFTEGLLRGTRVVVAKCGIGKVFSALCAQTMILCYHPEMIINSGVAGTMTDKLSIGQVAVAETVVQHDMDTSPLGDPVGLLSGLDRVALPTDPVVTARLAACVRALGVTCVTGTIASGDQFIAGSDAKERIRRNFPDLDLVACEMEGAAIGQVCYINRVPYTVLRAISDGGDEHAFADYPTFLAGAAHTAALVMEEFVKF